MHSFPVHNGTSKFDFSLHLIDHPEGFRLALEYSCDLFDSETAKAARTLREPAQGSGERSDCKVFDLPLLSLDGARGMSC